MISLFLTFFRCSVKLFVSKFSVKCAGMYIKDCTQFHQPGISKALKMQIFYFSMTSWKSAHVFAILKGKITNFQVICAEIAPKRGTRWCVQRVKWCLIYPPCEINNCHLTPQPNFGSSIWNFWLSFF